MKKKGQAVRNAIKGEKDNKGCDFFVADRTAFESVKWKPPLKTGRWDPGHGDFL